MPFVSRAQAGYFETHKKELERQGVDVGEWERATKGKHLPERAPKRHAGLFLTAMRHKAKSG